jgi:hypothetical protein
MHPNENTNDAFFLLGLSFVSYGQDHGSNLIANYCELLGFPPIETSKGTEIRLPNGQLVSAKNSIAVRLGQSILAYCEDLWIRGLAFHP